MSRPIYQVHYPKIGKITIKVDNIIMKYKHNDLVEEQAFFSKYPHIFKPRPDLSHLSFELAEVEEKMVESVDEFVPILPVTRKVEEPVEEEPVEEEPVEAAVAEIPVPTPTLITKQEVTKEEKQELLEKPKSELKIQSPSKGWYIVVDETENQIFPADGKKCRKKAAEKFLEENEK